MTPDMRVGVLYHGLPCSTKPKGQASRPLADARFRKKLFPPRYVGHAVPNMKNKSASPLLGFHGGLLPQLFPVKVASMHATFCFL